MSGGTPPLAGRLSRIPGDEEDTESHRDWTAGPLDHPHIVELQGALIARAAHLADEVESNVRKLAEDCGRRSAEGLSHGADRSVAELIVELGLFHTSNQLAELRAVEEALTKMHDGRYGRCAGCGDGIAYERLRACPAALRCNSCEAGVQRMHAPTSWF
jgi:DnaK suppressor protein